MLIGKKDFTFFPKAIGEPYPDIAMFRAQGCRILLIIIWQVKCRALDRVRSFVQMYNEIIVRQNLFFLVNYTCHYSFSS